METCPKSRLATLRAEKAPKGREDGGSAPRLLKETAGEKQSLFITIDAEKCFCVERWFRLLFCFLFVTYCYRPKRVLVFPASPPSPASLLQYSWIFCPALPFLFILQLGVVAKENQSPPRCVSQTRWASSLALNELPKEILSLSILCTSCKGINSCQLAFWQRICSLATAPGLSRRWLAVSAMRLWNPSLLAWAGPYPLLGWHGKWQVKLKLHLEPLTSRVTWLCPQRQVIYDPGFALLALLGDEAVPDRGYPSSLLLFWLELVGAKDAGDSNGAFRNIRRWRNTVEELADYRGGEGGDRKKKIC